MSFRKPREPLLKTDLKESGPILLHITEHHWGFYLPFVSWILAVKLIFYLRDTQISICRIKEAFSHSHSLLSPLVHFHHPILTPLSLLPACSVTESESMFESEPHACPIRPSALKQQQMPGDLNHFLQNVYSLFNVTLLHVMSCLLSAYHLSCLI